MMDNQISANSSNCKVCAGLAHVKFGLPRSKKTGHPIPDLPDDCWYYECARCKFLFTHVLDTEDHTNLYDANYWETQDPDWYGRVGETLRLVMLSNELLRKRTDEIHILDFGCGMGTFVDLGRRSLQMNVWGTDIIQPRFGSDYFLAELGDRKFDIVTACEVVEHLPFPRDSFATIRRHLKSPGVFAFQTAQWDSTCLGRDWWYLGPDNGHISLYSRESLDALFHQLGGRQRRMWRDYPGVQAWLFH